MSSRLKPIFTAVVGLAVAVLLIGSTAVLLKKWFAPMVTRDNAETVFTLFGERVKKGDVVIHDPEVAVSLANQSFSSVTDSAPLDGWAHRLRITARRSRRFMHANHPQCRQR